MWHMPIFTAEGPRSIDDRDVIATYRGGSDGRYTYTPVVLADGTEVSGAIANGVLARLKGACVLELRMTQITTGDLAKLFDTTPKTIADLVKRDLIVSAGKRALAARGIRHRIVRHLRNEAAARGSDDGQAARARQGQAQATLAEAKVGVIPGDLVEADKVEAFLRRWASGSLFVSGL